MLCGEPHCGQNRLPSGICAWQAEQDFIWAIAVILASAHRMPKTGDRGRDHGVRMT
jgi:hypothetical protein